MVGANGSALPNYEHEQPQRLNDHHSDQLDHENEHHQRLTDHHLPRSDRKNEHHQRLNDHHSLKVDRENDQIPHSQKAITSTPRRIRLVLPTRGPKPLLPRSLKEALQLASLLSKSKLVPKGFANPEACLVGILYGMEVGLSPIAALQRMAIIDGRPTIWGDAALALVEASGLLIKIEERIEILEVQTDHQSSNSPHDGKTSRTDHHRPDQSEERHNIKTRTAICQVLRSGRSEPITRSFSVEDAKRASLWQKPGPWTDYPDRMLMMRARAFALRDAFPDVLMGLYIREEFEGVNSQSLNSYREGKQSDWEENAINQNKIQSDWNEPSNSRTGRKEGYLTTTSRVGSYDRDRRTSDSNDREGVWHSYQTRDGRDRKLDRSNTIEHARRRAPPPPTEFEVDAPSRPYNQPKTPIEDLENNEDLPDLARSEEAARYQSGSDTLELFDSALACAKDEETLEEIREEFTERIDRLDSAGLQEAARILMQHEKRIRATEDTFKIKAQSFEPTTTQKRSAEISDEISTEGRTARNEDGLVESDDELTNTGSAQSCNVNNRVNSKYESEASEDSSTENATGRIGKEPLSPHRRRRFSNRPRKGLSLAELNARRKVDLLKYMPCSLTNEEDSDE